MSDEELLAAMVAEPTLVRRPLVIANGTMAAGFDRTGLLALVNDNRGSE